MVTDKKTRTVGSIIEMFERMTPAESLRMMKEKTNQIPAGAGPRSCQETWEGQARNREVIIQSTEKE